MTWVIRKKCAGQFSGADPGGVDLWQLRFIELRVVSDVSLRAKVTPDNLANQRGVSDHIFSDMVDSHSLEADRFSGLHKVAHGITNNTVNNIHAGNLQHTAFQAGSFGINNSQHA